jgi:hypothetical protein
VARTLREFELEPKGRAKTYQKPYPGFFDTIPYPRGFRVPEFARFTREDSRTTYEHIGQFLTQQLWDYQCAQDLVVSVVTVRHHV